MDKNKRSIGAQYEEKTCRFLQEKGYTLLASNYQTKFGEIDIIALKDKCLSFVEVKYRAYKRYGNPIETIGYHKRRNIVNSSKYYVMKNNYIGYSVSYDVAIWYEGKLTFYKQAFDVEGL